MSPGGILGDYLAWAEWLRESTFASLLAQAKFIESGGAIAKNPRFDYQTEHGGTRVVVGEASSVL